MTTAFQRRSRVRGELDDILVAEAMHAGVVTCSAGASLAVAARIMAAHRIHAVVVADSPADGTAPVLWGVVSDRDVLEAAAEGRLRDVTAGEAAVASPHAVTPTDTVARAAALMRRHGATHVVAVDAITRRPVGMLSTLDLVDVVSRDA